MVDDGWARRSYPQALRQLLLTTVNGWPVDTV